MGEFEQEVARYHRRTLKLLCVQAGAFALFLIFMHILLFGFDGLVPLYFKYVQGVHP